MTGPHTTSTSAPAIDDPPPFDGAARFLLFWKHRGRCFAHQLTQAGPTRSSQLLIDIGK